MILKWFNCGIMFYKNIVSLKKISAIVLKIQCQLAKYKYFATDC